MSVFDFPHVVDIVVDVNARDKYGGDSSSTQTVYAAEPAWVQTAKADDEEEAQRRDMRVTHVVYFQRDLALGTWHRIKHEGKTYEVQGFQDASSGLGVFWKAMALYRSGSGADA